MGPELWILVGAGSVVLVGGLGFWAGYSVGSAPVLLLRDQLAQAEQEIQDLAADLDAQRDAAALRLAGESRVSAAAGLPAGDAFRLLLDDGRPAPAPGGEAERGDRDGAGAA